MSCLDFLDLKKAFVLVDHDILSKKLAILVKNSCSRPFSKSYLDNRMHFFFFFFLLHESYFSQDSVKFDVPQGSVLGPIRFNLFIIDFPLHVKHISVDCDMLADHRTLHTSGEDISPIRSNIQDCLGQLRSGFQLV